MKRKETKKAFENYLMTNKLCDSKSIYKEEQVTPDAQFPTYVSCHLFYLNDIHVATWVKGVGTIFKKKELSENETKLLGEIKASETLEIAFSDKPRWNLVFNLLGAKLVKEVSINNANTDETTITVKAA